MKIRRYISVILALIMLSASFPAVASPKMPEPIFDTADDVIVEKYNPDDEVTFIVEVEGDPVLAGNEAALFGAEYIDTGSGQEKESEILSMQEDIINVINENVSANIDPISTYTLLFNGFAIKASYGNMDKIKNIPGVKNVYISEDTRIEPFLSTSVEMASSLPSQLAPYSGKGQVVAVIDTEFNTGHDFFKTVPQEPKYSKSDISNLISTQNLKASVNANQVYVNEKIPFAYDYCNESYDVYSTYAVHGSHVAGIIGGKNGKAADGNTINGVAPDCQLILMKVTTKTGTIKETAVFDALEDAVKLGVSAVNCSIGTDYLSPETMPVWEQSFNSAYNAGVFISVAAGNKSRGFYGQTPLAENIDYSAIGAPAAFSNVTAVASVNNSSSGSTVISSFSSYGVSESLELKPEITAPGGGIYSSVPDNTYLKKNGTSMAAPHITGAAILVNEYLDSIGSDTSGKDRLILTENLLMSTAVPARQSASNAPYSPRVQGAGIVNTAAAVKTPVVLIGDNSKSKISLGDELTDTFTVKFTVKNIGNANVTYDKISLDVITDGYSTNSGKNYVSDSKALTVLSDSLPETVSVQAGSDTAVSATVNLDRTELDAHEKIYKNGFFIDGFIRLEKSDNSLPAVGIPFIGFYGDWTKATVFDTTAYDEGGSTLVSSADNVGGTVLYTKINTSTKALGYNNKDGYSKEYIALSPNDDGLHDVLHMQLTPMRTISQITSAVTDKNGTNTILSATANILLNKFTTKPLGLNDIATLPDGDYMLNFSALYNYSKTSPTIHTLKIPFYVDTTVPEIIKTIPDGDTVNVTFRDNKHVSYVYTYYEDAAGTVHFDKKYIETPVEGEEVTKSFDLKDISASDADYEDIYIFVHDAAENYYVNSISALTGDIHPVMSDFVYSSNVLGVTFDIISYKSVQSCSMMLAFYDNSGTLVHLDIKNDVNLNQGESSHTFAGVADLTGAEKCRLFIWSDTETITPIDTAKDFDISSELAQ